MPFGQLIEDIALMDVNCNKCLEFDTIEFCQIVGRLFDKCGQEIQEPLISVLHNLFVRFSCNQGFLSFLGPDHLDTQQTNLRNYVMHVT